MSSDLQPVVWIAIAVLGIVFMAALLAVLLLCYRERRRRKRDYLGQLQAVNNPDRALVVDEPDMPQETVTSGVELANVAGSMSRDVDDILHDEDWIMDATGLAPHCLAILQTCHHLTEKLVGMTMSGNNEQLISPETMTDLVATAKRVGPRVDEVVRALYPPLDPRLLEARCTALVLSVSHLVLITKNACRLSGMLDWIDQSLADVEDHLRVLREASVNYDSWLNQPSNQIPECDSSPAHIDPNSLPPSGIMISHGPGGGVGGDRAGVGRVISTISGQQVRFHQTISGCIVGNANCSFSEETSGT